MNILIHPTYFPTVAHFVAISKAKTIRFEAADNFQKQTYRNRMFIYGANGKLLLNIPTKHNKKENKTSYQNTEIENIEDWQKQHWKSIVSAYKSSPFFEYYEDEIKDLFFTPKTSLYQLNIAIFKIICECIELDITIEYTEEFIKEYNTGDCIDLRVLVNAKKDITPQFENYTQVFGDKHGYLNNLSILDLLFNEGPNTLNYLESQAIFW
ncbi:MAG: WbqC family protein [Flavobacteriaceae bacterium]|nr:WbqC family protein [Flavobacteriaceae bacterium]